MKRTLKPLSLADAHKAAEALGLELDAVTPDALRKAFRDAVRALHPDVAAEMAPDVAERIQKAFKARLTLLSWLAQQPRANCRICKGRGYVWGGPFGTRPCPSC